MATTKLTKPQRSTLSIIDSSGGVAIGDGAFVRTLQHHTRFFSSLTLKNQWYIKDQTGNSAALAGLLRWRSEPDFRDYKFRENGFRKAKYTKVTKHAQGAGGSQ